MHGSNRDFRYMNYLHRTRHHPRVREIGQDWIRVCQIWGHRFVSIREQRLAHEEKMQRVANQFMEQFGIEPVRDNDANPPRH